MSLFINIHNPFNNLKFMTLKNSKFQGTNDVVNCIGLLHFCLFDCFCSIFCACATLRPLPVGSLPIEQAE